MSKIELVGNVAFLQESKQGAGFPVNTSGTPKTPNAINKLGSAKTGSGHDSFSKGIQVMLDVTAPSYLWQQIQRYSHFLLISSQSKMYKLKEFLDDTSLGNEYDNAKEAIILYQDKKVSYEDVLDVLPSGFELKARCTTNYMQLKTMYHQRKNHRLKFWNTDFVEFCHSLPEFDELMLGVDNG